MEGIIVKTYALVGKKLSECQPEELYEASLGMIVDEKEEMIRLIITPEARKKQREILIQQAADFNKKEFAGTFLVSHLENPDLVKAFLIEIKEGKDLSTAEKTSEKKPKKKTRKKKAKQEPQAEEEVNILERWDPELVKKLVSFLDGKPYAALPEIQEYLGTTEGEAYWLTQDLIYIGTLPGRWVGYDDGSWYYQIISDQPLSKKKKSKSKKSPSTKKTTKSAGTKKETKNTKKKAE